MGFLARLKELTVLRKTLETEQNNYDALVDRKEKLDKDVSKLDLQLSDKEKLKSDIRDVLAAENASIREKIVNDAKTESETIKHDSSIELATILKDIEQKKENLTSLTEENDSLQKEIRRYTNQARKYKSEAVSLKNFFKKYSDSVSAFNLSEGSLDEAIDEITSLTNEESLLQAIVNLPLHSDNSKELKKLSHATNKEIDQVLEKYKDRYNTKTNKALYSLMIVGLKAEMQLILFQLAYGKVSESKNKVSTILGKYVSIAADGNQSIKSTLLKFISEIEPLYMELVDIEYRYYMYRQKEKEEQQAIKEQMKQEAEERKALEAEQKKLDAEESKYKTEMERNRELLLTETDDVKVAQLQSRLAELEKQLENVADKKEEITSLAMGKAGYVYVISNLGSFGENVFKIGMTRRLEPQQRIDELGSASVPFRFDVHALIFSDNAVGLENSLHKKLTSSRINKVNFRKEFFKSSVDELETIVDEIDPTADFVKTMIAEEYNQSLAIESNDDLAVTA